MTEVASSAVVVKGDSSTIDELMSRDPLQLTQADDERLIAHLRAARHVFLIEEQKPKGKNRVAAPGDLSLDQLLV